jgi:phosphocarrier protein HPr
VEQSASITEKRVQIVNQKGLHARASAKFAAMALTFNAEVTVTKDGVTVNGCSIMGLLMLGAPIGQSILIRAKGVDAAKAVSSLEQLVSSKFGEE